ncbi:riboflavin biosynthesis protein RibD domain-containing protein [Sphaerosporella brunnea]|uniref:2,5-diamino-6-ribosylamino-4(3H)-pyrimidinone 5'-phosphate reductase n=1 Tax=Sphaerosporella brunnea TaxID=1250544 RepID=A0A5J5EFA3_9PEZI|nr:riboflavin biosynthesis protein RibD domain-containing protein [Sphaerosporella brunnea]KAA8894332.1 riboflavin biosynthesis protein RibD domain-containing protein [Sphaerosporella brunnea]
MATDPAAAAAAALTLPSPTAAFLAPYLPAAAAAAARKDRPFVTLTYAASLDSHLSVAAGTQTALSGGGSKALTHYLRAQHAAILVGASTAAADDPGLNSRLDGADAGSQPRPIILDPRFRWRFSRDARVLRAARARLGKAPWIFVARGCLEDRADERVRWVEEAGGRVVPLDDCDGWWSWTYLLSAMRSLGVESVMIEGGATVINDLLRLENRALLDSVVVTVAPVYLGSGGVNVSPQHEQGREGEAVVRFKDVQWQVLGRDVVMAARPETCE